KSGFILAQLEAEGMRAPVAPYGQAAAPQAPATQTQPAPAPWSVNIAQTPPPAPRQAAAPAPQPIAPVPPKTAAAPVQRDTRSASLNPPPSTAPPVTQPVPLAANGYTVDEIREAGKGVFGTLTSEFAILVNQSFKTWGQPNAYIVGDEGGGAFLAGLRYGD